MKSLKNEVLAFVRTISNRELTKNPDLRRKLKNLRRYLKDSYTIENNEMLKYLDKELLFKN